MPRRIQRRSPRELLTIASLALLIVWLAFLLHGIYRKEEIARQTVAQTRAELASLDVRKASLAGTVNELGTERGQEASLRETYGVAKPGEDVIIVVPKKETTPPPEITWWQKVKEFFDF